MTLFAVLLFALLPLMALIIHTGFITLTRRQMQTAVNTAAKEGLRSELTMGTSRDNVSTLVSHVFDGDFDTGTEEANLGAGPEVPMSGGILLSPSDFRASKQIDGDNIGTYRPNLQTNSDNAVHGDMVAGQRVALASTHLEGPDADLGLQPYERFDFIPVDEPGYSSTDAFLVRMRRTNDLDARRSNEGQNQEDGISSWGNPVPFLFGRVPYGNEDGGTSLLNQRERGTIVRATAIAHTQPVVTVGEPSTDVEMGLAVFEINSADWNDPMVMTTGTPVAVTLQINGSITGGLTGRFIVRGLTTLGDPTTGLGSIPADLEVDSDRVAAITADINGIDRVVAFGMARLTEVGGGYFITRLDAEENVPFQNAVSTFVKPLNVSGTDFTDVWDAFQLTPERALSGVLVRAIE